MEKIIKRPVFHVLGIRLVQCCENIFIVVFLYDFYLLLA
jgi:hypothetical protein